MSDYYSHSRPELRPYLPEQYHRVLEVGCAEGRFARNYLPGTEVWGVEPSTAAAQAVTTGARQVNEAGHAISELVAEVGKVSGLVAEISAASDESGPSTRIRLGPNRA